MTARLRQIPRPVILAIFISLAACSETHDDEMSPIAFEAVLEAFEGRIDLNSLDNYENQTYPDYIRRDNTRDNVITDAGATLGRVLFYDTKLSIDNTVSCSSCHQQAFGFSDPEVASQGVNGTTGRHSMRLVNGRFAEEENFFWDERATDLEDQTTQPIQDHVEMGFSGQGGDPGFDKLIEKLSAEAYYSELFTLAFDDEEITELRIQEALAQFVRSIQSFDSRFDDGLSQVNDVNDNFPNFTDLENLGKRLYLRAPDDGGAGCQGCHRAPEFDIDPDTRNNGIIGVIGQPEEVDLEVTRAPTLRDLLNPDGQLNGSLMHNAIFDDLESVVAHYDQIPDNPANNNLDRRLGDRNRTQNLRLSENERGAIVAFLQTLTGSSMYNDEKLSDPF